MEKPIVKDGLSYIVTDADRVAQIPALLARIAELEAFVKTLTIYGDYQVAKQADILINHPDGINSLK